MAREQFGEMMQIGWYRHFKGGEYFVIGEATHSETGERLIVYRALYGEQGLWVRPHAMFFGTVVIDGHEVPRFMWVGDRQEGQTQGSALTNPNPSPLNSNDPRPE